MGITVFQLKYSAALIKQEKARLVAKSTSLSWMAFYFYLELFTGHMVMIYRDCCFTVNVRFSFMDGPVFRSLVACSYTWPPFFLPPFWMFLLLCATCCPCCCFMLMFSLFSDFKMKIEVYFLLFLFPLCARLQ